MYYETTNGWTGVSTTDYLFRAIKGDASLTVAMNEDASVTVQVRSKAEGWIECLTETNAETARETIHDLMTRDDL